MCGFDVQVYTIPVVGSQSVTNVTTLPWVGLSCSCDCAEEMYEVF